MLSLRMEDWHWDAVRGACPHAAAFDGIRTGGQRNGHTTAPAFLGKVILPPSGARSGDRQQASGLGPGRQAGRLLGHRRHGPG